MSLHFTHICSCIYCYSGVYSYCTHWSILWRDKCVPNTGAQQYPERWCIHWQCRYICCNIESYAVRHTKKKYLQFQATILNILLLLSVIWSFFLFFFWGEFDWHYVCLFLLNNQPFLLLYLCSIWTCILYTCNNEQKKKQMYTNSEKVFDIKWLNEINQSNENPNMLKRSCAVFRCCWWWCCSWVLRAQRHLRSVSLALLLRCVLLCICVCKIVYRGWVRLCLYVCIYIYMYVDELTLAYETNM